MATESMRPVTYGYRFLPDPSPMATGFKASTLWITAHPSPMATDFCPTRHLWLPVLGVDGCGKIAPVTYGYRDPSPMATGFGFDPSPMATDSRTLPYPVDKS
jgi:hypothetical protein